MPTELTYTDGTADFFEVGTQRSAWHREGHLIPPDRAIRIPDALRMIHGDYEVVRRPTFYEVGVLGEDLRPSQRAYVTIRTDTGTELGSVGRSYTVLQNREAFRALEPLLDQGVVRLETGGVLRSGADIWMLGRFDTQRKDAGAGQAQRSSRIPRQHRSQPRNEKHGRSRDQGGAPGHTLDAQRIDPAVPVSGELDP